MGVAKNSYGCSKKENESITTIYNYKGLIKLENIAENQIVSEIELLSFVVIYQELNYLPDRKLMDGIVGVMRYENF